ncbi:AraC family transcriptional regulator [Streptacidiphilus fuscans]|uniref:AraC family transcriptional regulator n=1 Tax=Streptacidiphilus fuscans TaxID=2789292 RepID=A0A931FIW5_9ACTN|nr:AraC family transcriptional regulator [Streptacidiphilus fuscans]MBF9073805.1 AraC family transcriptional regulator [Streptacidiphilus fuscans]
MAKEIAHYWQHPALPGVDLLRAHYVRHSFGKHTHDGYVLASVTSGVEAFHYRGELEVVPAGSVALVEPDRVHTGHAGVPDGWSYSVLYPGIDQVVEVAEEVGALPGAPGFGNAVVHDDELSRLVLQTHRAAEQNQVLAASTFLRLALGVAVRRHSSQLLGPGRSVDGRGTASAARDLLMARLDAPPTLEELAAAVDARPFPLLRAFREAYGLPPHAWLTQQRVRTAQVLLGAGTPPAEVAVTVGFVDQAHLTRHFRRIVGVPPGAYARARKNVQETID